MYRFWKDSKDIFEGLKITKQKEFCEKWMNEYPVLFISFKDVEGETFEGAYKMLKTRLADACKDIAELANEICIDEDDKEIFAKLKSKSGDEDEVKNSLKTIMRMMHAVYGKKVILLIDEYDVPIAKESIFTGTNNFGSYSVLDEDFSEYFGFSEEEVEKILTAAERTEAAEVIKEWYNGYVFGDSSVYCPWDVINYMSSLRYKRTAKPKNYWKNTSHNGILLSFVGL